MKTSNQAGPQRSASAHLLLARRGCTGVLRNAFILPALAILLPCAALAATHSKKVKPAVDIIASGKVISSNKAPAADAIVYLEDPQSMAIKSYLTGQNGEFHFTDLAPQTDYEVWAEQNGAESKHKFISKFSSHTHFAFTLKLDPAHKHKLLGFL